MVSSRMPRTIKDYHQREYPPHSVTHRIGKLCCGILRFRQSVRCSAHLSTHKAPSQDSTNMDLSFPRRLCSVHASPTKVTGHRRPPSGSAELFSIRVSRKLTSHPFSSKKTGFGTTMQQNCIDIRMIIPWNHIPLNMFLN